MWYTVTHEWVTKEGNHARIGVTDFAQRELGDIVYVELPTVGKAVKKGDVSVVLESTKAAADVYAPLSGTILSVNEELKQAPEKINLSAEEQGWLFTMSIDHQEELNTLLQEKPA